MELVTHTFKSPKRYFLIEIRQNASSTVLTAATVKQWISALFLRLFGTDLFGRADLDVFLQSPTRAICSIQNELAVKLRCALVLPPVELPGGANIESFHVMREASFIQSLFHNSRTDFPPLV
jgi:hypothetical protein